MIFENREYVERSNRMLWKMLFKYISASAVISIVPAMDRQMEEGPSREEGIP